MNMQYAKVDKDKAHNFKRKASINIKKIKAFISDFTIKALLSVPAGVCLLLITIRGNGLRPSGRHSQPCGPAGSGAE